MILYVYLHILGPMGVFPNSVVLLCGIDLRIFLFRRGVCGIFFSQKLNEIMRSE